MNSRLGEIIRNCVDNEIAMDRANLSLLEGEHLLIFQQFPFRPLKFSKLSIFKRKILLCLLCNGLVLAFLLVLKVIFDFTRSLFTPSKAVCSSHDIAVVSSYRSVKLISSAVDKDAHEIEFCKISNFSGPGFSVFRYIDYFDKLRCLFLCVWMVFYLFHISNGLDKRLRVVNLYDVFMIICLHELIKKNDREGCVFYTTNHYDRWAYVLSRSVNRGQLQIVQHGFVNSDLTLPHRGGYVDLVKVVDNSFFGTFDPFYTSVGRYETYCVNLDIVDIRHGSQYIVLIISSPNLVETELRRLNNLARKYSGVSRFIFKPHPLYSYDYKALDAVVEVWSDSTSFPVVDLVVHSGSFLALEYGSLGFRLCSLGQVDTYLSSTLVSEV